MLKILPSFSKKISLFIGLLFLAISLNAQQVAKKNVDDLTDAEVEAFFKKAQSSGMSEAQIEKAAKAQGYQPSDIQKMRDRISKIKSNKEQNGTTEEDEENDAKDKVGRQTQTTKKLSKEKAGNVDKAESSTESQLDEENIGKTLLIEHAEMEIFGESLFNNKTLTFEPDLRIATPKNYVLGPDDELNIDVFGDVLDNYKVKISPEGTIKILNLSPIYVNGLSMDVATERIVSRMRQLYQGLNRPGSGSSAVVTLGNVRSIKVTMVGEVKNPGSYTISSLATIFNALYLAGGPNRNGSMRNIKVIRNNKVYRTLDLYDFLLRADQKDNIQLHDQDVIRISEYETRVSVAGEVKRPMMFEVQKGESLKDVLRFAGGFTEKAYTYTIPVTRNTSREKKLLNVTQDEVATFLPNNGDVYKVGAILNRFENRVEVLGAVFRPGEYAIESGLSTVKELVKKAEGLRENAFLNRAILARKKENFDPEIVSIDLGKILRGEIADIPLQREDILTVYFQEELREKRKVTIDGQLNKPGIFEYYDGMRLADLVLLAKGFKEGASFSKIEVARRIIDPNSSNDNNGTTVEIFSIPIEGDLKLSDKGSQFVLMPFDKVSIKSSPTFEKQRNIFITGQVNFPGSYTLGKTRSKVSDLIELAGGLRTDNYIGGAKLFRDSTTVGVDLVAALKNPNSEENINLVEGDSLYVPRINETIKVTGGVQNNVYLSYNKSKSVRNYLSEAGGVTDLAIKKEIYVKNQNGKSAQVKRFLFFKSYPKVYAGAEIVVPEYPKDKKKGLTTGEAIGLASSLTSVSIAIISLIRIL
ncbi:sugar transporter [Sandaracinomonas limnophila]|uniref:Sugar transporter n=1 Tax=Sandaracinomonas limnophila TaxID=1862386 RepID=A0A437PMV5_9BACT|nr:SLBB domain-containing protein [Sandaracinomonas limnophila]RVU23636.1 sugar transporter [Sandaracinomonas limnophila]